MEEQKQKGTGPAKVSVPFIIIIGGIVISLGIVVSSYMPSSKNNAQTRNDTIASESFDIRPLDNLAIKKISESDHLIGNNNAPVKIIEYSDLECPFCKKFHPEIKHVVDTYAGQVAWIYRHLPIKQLHSQAHVEAESSECAYELGGNDIFWHYIDTVYEITPSNDGLDLALLPALAQSLGIDTQKFSECVSSGRKKAIVESSVQDAISAGARGTPFTVIITRNGKYIPFNGALSEDNIKILVENALIN